MLFLGVVMLLSAQDWQFMAIKSEGSLNNNSYPWVRPDCIRNSKAIESASINVIFRK